MHSSHLDTRFVWKVAGVVYQCRSIRVPSRAGKPGKMRVHLENLEYHGILKNLINIMEK